MRVVIQIGYIKSLGRRRIGQSVRAFINDAECSWRDECGQWITTRVDGQKGISWYLWSSEDVMPQDVIKLEVKTFVIGAGPDEDKTFESLYYVDENVPVKEITVHGVGKNGYPLIKGRVVQMGSVSEADKRDNKIQNFLDDESF